MLTLRERIIILYATAPDDFAATRVQLRVKYQAKSRNLAATLRTLTAKHILAERPNGELVAGRAMREELGADE